MNFYDTFIPAADGSRLGMADSRQELPETESPPRSMQFAVTCFGTDSVGAASACTYSGP
jgi:hypothetical protein